MAAAERSREEGAAETWDRMALPEDVRRALRDGPRFGQSWRQLLRRLAPRPAGPRHRPASAPMCAHPPARRQQPVSVPEGIGPSSTAIVPVPEAALPAIVPRAHLSAELLALRLRPDDTPDPARLPSCRRVHDLVPVLTAPGIPALPSIRLRRAGHRSVREGAAAGPGAVGAGQFGWRERLGRLGGSRRTWFGAAALVLLALVGYQSAIDPSFRPAVQIPGLWDPSHELSPAAALHGGSPAALEQYRRASELDPGNPVLLYRWAQALEQHGELEQALATYRRAAALTLRTRPKAGD